MKTIAMPDAVSSPERTETPLEAPIVRKNGIGKGMIHTYPNKAKNEQKQPVSGNLASSTRNDTFRGDEQ